MTIPPPTDDERFLLRDLERLLESADNATTITLIRLLAAERAEVARRDAKIRILDDTLVAVKVYVESCHIDSLKEQITSQLDNVPWLLEDYERYVNETDTLMHTIDQLAERDRQIAALANYLQRFLDHYGSAQIPDDVDAVRLLRALRSPEEAPAS